MHKQVRSEYCQTFVLTVCDAVFHIFIITMQRKYPTVVCILVACVIIAFILSTTRLCGGTHVVLSDVCIRNTITMATQEAGLSNGVSYQNWMILMTVNTAYLDFLQNWFSFYRRLKLNVPVTLIAEDRSSFEKLSQLYNNYSDYVTIEQSGNENAEDPADFNTPQFFKLVGQRPAHILKYLRLGYNVVYTDTDTVWLKDPFPHFVGMFDIWAQLDNTTHCTGFLAIQCNERTLQFAQDWKSYMKGKTTINDQTGFEEMDRSDVCIQGLNTDFFPAGYQYFGFKNITGYSENKMLDVVVVHNNWIVGHDQKKERFKTFNLWHEDKS